MWIEAAIVTLLVLLCTASYIVGLRSGVQHIKDEGLIPKGRVDKLKQMTDLQCTPGNWDYDPYMHGMANGMIYAHWLMMGNEMMTCPFKETPPTWGRDRVRTNVKPAGDEASPFLSPIKK
jgi:hypothetical protein